jgi:hypothetical protein
VAVPLNLQNRSDAPDLVELSAAPLSVADAGMIPLNLIRFDPDTIEIPPKSEGAVQLIVHLTPRFTPGSEYWAEILISGAESRRIPLVLQILSDGQPSAEFEGR